MCGNRLDLKRQVIQPKVNHFGIPVRIGLLHLLQGALRLEIFGQGLRRLVAAESVSLLDQIVDVQILIVRPFGPRDRNDEQGENNPPQKLCIAIAATQ